ncbi:MAG: Txe/YoeB family addiction module toxin [Treponema sp.]|nr:Txe/YoeB family addiction module toxin [Treponema sp.]
MNIIWTQTAWSQYVQWQSVDKSMIKKINELIKSICRDGILEGIGKPEPLKHIKACSRRINDENRFVYNLDTNGNLIVFACIGHYED